MKPKELFKLAVRLLGLIFLYQGLMLFPTLFTGIFGGIGNAIMMILMFAWPMLVAYVLLRHAAQFVDFCYLESED
jgi:hypothetical protein